ncbi:MAG: ribonuclease H-like domain-containing protein, partial [Candidatus Altiarchaeota archaeon]|nr:ribonuclease H-like domain-containing protein [Candidatus Altiarchaeota archaeon]
MLTSTFCHIPGFGEKTEKHLWWVGCHTWDDFLEKDWGLTREKYMRLKAGILESKARLDEFDHTYFRDKLPKSQSWRAYRTFKDDTCYLDIETTGLSASRDHVTTVCIHSTSETKTYIMGENLDELQNDLLKYKYLVSFNGARFDLPFLEKNQEIHFTQIHLDLIYPMRWLGYSGGLKAIEHQLGMQRNTDGVTGYDAVRLWRSYKTNREIEVAGQKVKGKKALELLVTYNREDTVNLEKLANHTVTQLLKRYRKI